MRIAVAQLDPVVGAFAANVRKILAAYEQAGAAGVELLITPELSVCGYPPHDLLERPEIFDRNEQALTELGAASKKFPKTALSVGHVARNLADTGRAARNLVTVLHGGREVFSQAKRLLPTYDVFDEARYFEPAAEIKLWDFGGQKIAMAICEDLWAQDEALGRRLYGHAPELEYAKNKATLVISTSASPYEWGKRERREKVHGEVARRLGAPLLYVNQVGATDEVLFDGASFGVDRTGALRGRLPFFKPAFGIYDVAKGVWESPEAREDNAPAEIEILHRGLVSGIREYFARSGFRTAILGLSGGIDSAVVGVLAAQALGPENVLGVAMPSQYSSAGSLTDAETLATRLGIRFEVKPIKFAFATMTRDLSEGRGQLAPLALENLQSRLRGLALMTLSNHFSALVLTTGNKSELATGYCTLYGDMCGALAPIGDLYKTRVYELARYINERYSAPIPEASITKAPSAELRPDQKDQDTLPPYDALDAVLEDYLEKAVPLSELEARHAMRVARPGWIAEVLRKVEINEFKRRQAAPVLKASPKAFGIGRRIPIARSW